MKYYNFKIESKLESVCSDGKPGGSVFSVAIGDKRYYGAAEKFWADVFEGRIDAAEVYRRYNNTDAMEFYEDYHLAKNKAILVDDLFACIADRDREIEDLKGRLEETETRLKSAEDKLGWVMGAKRKPDWMSVTNEICGLWDEFLTETGSLRDSYAVKLTDIVKKYGINGL